MSLQDNLSPSFKTKMHIFQTIVDLSQDRPYENISVIDICKAAGIGRSTFYHHFYNKDEVLQFHTNLLWGMGLDRIGIDLNWYDGNLYTTREMYPYREFYMSAPSNLSNPSSARSAFIRHRIEVLSKTLRDYHNVELTPLLNFQMETLAVAEAHASRLFYIDRTDFNSIEEYCTAMATLVPHELFALLNTPAMEPTSNYLLAFMD